MIGFSECTTNHKNKHAETESVLILILNLTGAADALVLIWLYWLSARYTLELPVCTHHCQALIKNIFQYA